MNAVVDELVVDTQGLLETKRKIFGDLLKHHVMTVTFKKKDGTDRRMNCTLREDIVPKVVKEEKKTVKRKEPETSISVWDIDADGWRAFTIDSVQTFAFCKSDAKPEEVA